MSGPKPAYLLTGSDGSLVGQALDRLLAELVGDGDRSMMVESFDDPDAYTPDAVADAAQTPAFLSDRRIVVARGIGAFKTEALKPLTAYLESPLDTTTVVLVHDGEGRLAPVVSKSVKAAGGEVVSAAAPGGAKGAEQFWSARIAESGLKPDRRARQVMIDHLGDDVGRAQAVLEALATAHGAGARLTEDDVLPFLGQAGSVKPWDLTDAIDRGDTATALSMLARLMEAGGFHAMQVMGVLSNHFGRAIRLDGSGARGEQQAHDLLGLKGKSTFPAKKALNLSRKMGHDGAVQAAVLLADADLELRGVRDYGPGDATNRLVMEVLVARLCRAARAGDRASSR